MPTKILIQEMDGTPAQITFGDHATDYSPTAANDLRHASAVDTEVQLDLTSVANNAARQSAKFDLGEHYAAAYKVRAALEFAATPVAGEYIAVYIAPSQHATAANGNPGNCSGSDAAYTGYSSNLADSLKHLEHVGTAAVTAQATGTVQVMEVGTYYPGERYGCLVFENQSDAAMHSDAVEMGIYLDPIIAESQ